MVTGYLVASLARPLIAFAHSAGFVLAVRLVDRFGKGLRSSPRDALIADVAPPELRGRAFGVHEAMDHAGAVVGPLVAYVLLAVGVAMRSVFLPPVGACSPRWRPACWSRAAVVVRRARAADPRPRATDALRPASCRGRSSATSAR